MLCMYVCIYVCMYERMYVRMYVHLLLILCFLLTQGEYNRDARTDRLRQVEYEKSTQLSKYSACIFPPRSTTGYYQ